MNIITKAMAYLTELTTGGKLIAEVKLCKNSLMTLEFVIAIILFRYIIENYPGDLKFVKPEKRFTTIRTWMIPSY